MYALHKFMQKQKIMPERFNKRDQGRTRLLVACRIVLPTYFRDVFYG
jgi:hypothetical protein